MSKIFESGVPIKSIWMRNQDGDVEVDELQEFVFGQSQFTSKR